MENIYTEIGKKIRKCREDRKISQDDLAKKLGYASRSMLSAMELGKRRISAEALIKIAEFLEVSVVQLIPLEKDSVKEQDLELLLKEGTSLPVQDIEKILAEFKKYKVIQ